MKPILTGVSIVLSIVLYYPLIGRILARRRTADFSKPAQWCILGLQMRTFKSGATRDGDLDKLDYEGFLSPLVLRRFGEYMHLHRKQADGKLRASDNWQKGIPKDAYMKSLWRHFMDVWISHRGHSPRENVEDALCAVMFNAMGYLHELLKDKP